MREFKRQFGVRLPIRCALEDLSGQVVANGTRCDLEGLSCMSRTSKSAWIKLDPVRAWEATDGPRVTAFHEFLHVLVRDKANRSPEHDEEEIAVRMLTDLLRENISA